MLYDQISTHDFSLIPRAEIPRSLFKMRHSHKTTFDAGLLIPIYCEELLPGDEYRGAMHAIARLATPITPFMDDLTLESFFFFVPNRLVWDNWQKFMGERRNPSDAISFTVPTVTTPAGGYTPNSLQDYFGLPVAGQITGVNTVTHQCLPLRAYNLIYNEWFRDQNLINSAVVDVDDGPDSPTDYVLRRRGKRHDYFTSCLPWPQKGTAPTLSFGGNATVFTAATDLVTGAQSPLLLSSAASGGKPGADVAVGQAATTGAFYSSASAGPTSVGGIYPSNLYADLSTATAQTINAIRTAFQIQRLLERDARGGTRYTEILKSHFGVISPDMRLQRPEYIGGGSTPIVINGVVQNSQTATTPQGNLAATGTMVTQGGHDFRYAATEHGYIIGIINVRGENTYQQGLRRHWSRSTRYDYYFPAFAHLGEQAVLNKEIYVTGTSTDNDVFGYQERYGEYRYHPSLVTGLFRSTTAANIDIWHLAQEYSSLPTLNQTFIEESPPVDRVIAVPSSTGKQLIFDSLFEVVAARPMPMYGVPGLVDHF